MILKLKFIFIMDCLIMNRADECRTALRGLVLVLTLVLGFAVPATWAQPQTASGSTQTAAPASPSADAPASAPSDAAADPESMFPHFKNSALLALPGR